MSFKMKWYGNEVKERMRQAALSGLSDAAEHILGEANKTAPIDEGTLRRSGSVAVDEEEVRAYVSYDTPYAVRLHEDSGYNFLDPSARHKWLQLTMQEQQKSIQDYLADALRAAH